jgi:hypothetical protein
MVACASSVPAPPTNFHIVIESCRPEIFANVLKTWPDMTIIYADTFELKPGYFVRLEIYDFDGNRKCDFDSPEDGGITFRKDPDTNNKWVRLGGPYDCANAKIVRDNIIEIRENSLSPKGDV